jgi:outer membrane receptor protein involved in Fe transport
VSLIVQAAALGSATLLLWSDVALAQDGDLEDILVTGSRIARPDFEAPSPIVTLPAAAFEQTAAVSVERTLNTLPQFAPSATGTSNDPANDGQANVSLRGIGVAQTLVLLDGRRLMPADGRGSPDLNVLPPALIAGVEIVTGGASAAYGSDAIAGVVNFKLKDSFEGVQVDGQWAQTGQGDGQDYTVGLTAGTSFADGRGSVMGYAGYTERDQVNQGDRSLSRYPLQYFPDEKNGIGPRQAFIAAGSTIIEAGNSILFSSPAVFDDVFASYGYAPGTVPYQASLSVNPDGTLAPTVTALQAASPTSGASRTRRWSTIATTPTTSPRLRHCRCRSSAPRCSCAAHSNSRRRPKATCRPCTPITPSTASLRRWMPASC